MCNKIKNNIGITETLINYAVDNNIFLNIHENMSKQLLIILQ